MTGIRAYEDKDRAGVENICIATAGRRAAENRLWAETILHIYCRYYITKAKEFCFVAVDEQDNPIGYILCAPDRNAYKRDFLRCEVRAIRQYSFIYSLFALGEIISSLPFERKYPAHLHIDLLEGYRHMGIGSALINRLCDKLKKENIRGVMLSVSATNKNAVSFYIKNGFRFLLRTKIFYVMGRELL
ncbi:MAG: Acetyltransferase (GNAT) family protein [Firmicutes bacterium ADurb.Bin300]|nr:MAG: Acetyltransferase (GNAT) family protein [Firmicutes bacterium ADurb.Bin300]